MAHARIDLHRALEPRMPEISEAILRGMVTGFRMPADDLFQIFRLHEPGELSRKMNCVPTTKNTASSLRRGAR